MWRLLLVVVTSSAVAADLRFVRDGTELRAADVATVMRSCTPETILVDDPYYAAKKRYLACPLGEVLAFGFGKETRGLDGEDVMLRARDGYVKVVDSARLAEPGAYLAFGDATLSSRGALRFAPLGRKSVDPGPLYLVWTGDDQRDPHRHPWPYQLAEIEVTDFQRRFPHTVPTGAPRDAPAWEGFAIFRSECVACHAVNGEGGRVGPELNVPRSIVEYWSRDQIKEYIRDPSTFRYGNMPDHRHLSSEQLEALVAYFETMRSQKRDPGAPE